MPLFMSSADVMIEVSTALSSILLISSPFFADCCAVVVVEEDDSVSFVINVLFGVELKLLLFDSEFDEQLLRLRAVPQRQGSSGEGVLCGTDRSVSLSPFSNYFFEEK
jgi:hypothetical protein